MTIKKILNVGVIHIQTYENKRCVESEIDEVINLALAM
jgi:hypothetical protein